ncbi:hypothetical protein OROMI_003387 [Orobanche minor]
MFKKMEDEFEDEFSDDGEEENEGFDAEEVSEDENNTIQSGHAQFVEGIKVYKLAFKKIVKKSKVDEDVLVLLSADKKLIAEKLAEEEVEKKVKGETKKEKHLASLGRLEASYARWSLERFWLQNWIGPSLSGSSLFIHCNDMVDSGDGSSLEPT